MERMLVTGGSGLLGHTVATEARAEYEVTATYLNHPVQFAGTECIQIDLTEESEYGRLRSIDPDAIINCVAMTDVDACETNPEAAYAHNVEIAKSLAILAADVDAQFVHISTGAVFDGTGTKMTEDDEPAPINVYGETKLEGERAVREYHEDSVIVRTTIYGWNRTAGQSLAEWMLSKLRNGEELPAFEDAYFSPIYTGSLATCLLELLETEFQGVLHIAGRERCSKLEFAYRLADIFDLDDGYIVPSSIEDVDFEAPRGHDLSLSVETAERVLDCRLPTVDEGLEHMREDES